MNKITKILGVSLLFLILTVQGVFSQDNDVGDFKYLYFQTDIDAQTNKVAYAIEIGDGNDYDFGMKIEYNGIVQEKICQKDLFSSNDMSFKKIICEIPKYGDGNYVFISTITDKDGNIVSKLKNKENVFENVNSGITFQVNDDDTTTIIINVEGEGDDLRVMHRIPKEVIESLTVDNKEGLIKTDFDYEIIEEDPLIAWNIDRPPAKINYTINQKLNDEEMGNFDVEITSKPMFNYLKIITFFLIIGILTFLAMPLFKKDKKKKKN